MGKLNFPGPANLGNLVVELFTDAGGLPTAVAAAGANTGVLTGIDTGLVNVYGNEIYKWSLAFSPIALTGGTTYWLGVKSPEANRLWIWSNATSDGSGDVVLRNTNSGSWFHSVGNPPGTDSQAFAFGGTSTAPVPEPASLAMWGLGALGMMFARRKRRQMMIAA